MLFVKILCVVIGLIFFLGILALVALFVTAMTDKPEDGVKADPDRIMDYFNNLPGDNML
jgi:hypothetical protein